MKILSLFLLVVMWAMLLVGSAFAVGPLMVQAHTAAWDPNSETDLGGYYVYYRPVTSPVTAWDNSRRSTVVPVSTTPTYNLLTIITINGSYEVMVTATDTAGNESGPSNIVPFVVDLPSAPKNNRIQ